MCKATLDFVEHQQSTSLTSLLQRRPAPQPPPASHGVDTDSTEVFLNRLTRTKRGRSPLRDCFDLGNVFL